ncbi:MAG: O-unit flippase-like protein [Porphyromonadaceae bacterium]|nr:O-unit flippase-like protein [Porphyromonadaceae bacterium]
MEIGKKDFSWNIAATLLKLASGILILPVILKYFTADEVGIWMVFLSFSTIVLLFDFGFSNTFTRNITYIFSGANRLHCEGFEYIESGTGVNFELLKSTIRAMKWFYTRISLVILVFLLTGGSIYIYHLISKSFVGNSNTVYVSWLLYSCILCYQTYTLYLDSLMLGRGLVKRNKQIIIIAQLLFLLVSSLLIIFFKTGLLGIVVGQLLSIITNRVLSYLAFYDQSIKSGLSVASSTDYKKTLHLISPNAIRIGITSLGSFLVNRSSIFVGSLYLPLASIASYGVSKQVADIIVNIASVYFYTFYPKMIKSRVNGDNGLLKSLYLRSDIIYISLFVFMGGITVLFGNVILIQINSNTLLLQTLLLILLLFVSFLETNHSLAGSVLLTKNEVPFFRASIVSGLLTILLLFMFIHSNFGIISLILAPGVAQLIYQNWKWPLEVKRDLKITIKDFTIELKNILKKAI